VEDVVEDQGSEEGEEEEYVLISIVIAPTTMALLPERVTNGT
jgi:hypothetical protein